MFAEILLLFFVLFAGTSILMLLFSSPAVDTYDVVEEELTEIIETTGDLTVKTDDKGRDYVIDPADGRKCFVADTDDMYEDAAGNIWRLV